jgi:hypothetical protein
MTDQALTTTEAPRPKPPAFQTGGAVGALVPQTLEEGFRLAQAMAMSGMTPRDIDTPEKVLVCIMAGAELGMKPFQAVQSFAIVNGRPSLWGDGLMALALTNGLDVEEWMEGDGDDRVAFCRVTRPDNGKVVTRDYSVEKAKTAKLWGKVSASGKPSPWVTSPERMLQMRARSYAIRDAAADVLRGMPIREEVEDFMESNPGIMDRQEEPKGTGLLAKLETAQVLGEAAVAGFGIRDVSDEAGAAAPAPETKPKRSPRKKAVDDALNAAGDEMAAETLSAIAEAEPEIVAQVVEDHAPQTVEELVEELDADITTLNESLTAGKAMVDEHLAALRDGAIDPENLPADAQVEESDAIHPSEEGAASVASNLADAVKEALGVIDGPAPAETIYFLAGEEPYPSGRRAVWFNGKPNGSEDAAADFPVYTQHPGEQASEASAPESAETAAETPAEAATAEDGVGAELSPIDAFDAAIATATTADELVEAMTALFATDDFKTADQKRIPRQRLWARVAALNEAGAKIDPVKFPYIMGSFVEASSDIEAIEALLVLARDEEWFKAGGEGMQTAVARAVMDRVAVLKGAG